MVQQKYSTASITTSFPSFLLPILFLLSSFFLFYSSLDLSSILFLLLLLLFLPFFLLFSVVSKFML